MRVIWLFAIAGVIGCSDKAPPAEPGIEATVVEVKQVAAAPVVEPPTPVVEPPKPVVVETPKPPPPVKAMVVRPKKNPTQPVARPEPATTPQSTTPQPDPNKSTLEQNPYVYK